MQFRVEFADFVEKGGLLLSTFKTGLYREDGSPREDFALGEITGARGYAMSPYSVDYIDRIDPSIAGHLPELPLLVSPDAPPARSYPEKRTRASLLAGISFTITRRPNSRATSRACRAVTVS